MESPIKWPCCPAALCSIYWSLRQAASVVFYNDAQFVKVASIRGIIGTNLFSFCDDFKEDILTKIKTGLLLSPHTPNKIKDYCRVKFNL